MVESSLVLWGSRIIAVSKGKPCEVEFDFEAVWQFKKEAPNTWKTHELTWLHVHPIGYGCQASAMDQNCAEGLQLAFGNIGWFGILCFDNTDPDDPCGDIAWYRMVDSKLTLQDRHMKPESCNWENHRILTWYDLGNELSHVPHILKALSVSI